MTLKGLDSNSLSVVHLNDERMAGLLDAVSDYAIYLLTPEGRIASWNVGGENITGYTSEEAIGLHFYRFFSSDDLSKNVPARLLHEAEEHKQAEREGWQIRKDGSRYWATLTVNPIIDKAGCLLGYSNVIRDITERMVAQSALLESERRFRILVDGVTDYAIYMLDPSGVVTNWNAGAERMKGYTADEIVGQHFSRFYSRDDRAAGKPAIVLDIAAREGRYEAEGWRYRKDGSRFWASVVIDAIHDDKGALIGFGKITRDISERRAAQEALRESEQQFRMLVNGVRDYAIYMLDPNGVIVSWNTGAERIKGYSAGEIIGQHFSRFYTEDDRARGMPAQALASALRDGRIETEAWRLRKDGSVFWANVVLEPIQNEKGALVGFTKITRDITERRDAQIALVEAQSQRNQAQKMDALGQLTGGVAHDFNNLLMIVSGQNHLLNRIVGDHPKGSRAVEAIQNAVTRGASLTRQLLSFSRRQTLAPKVLDVTARIEAFKAMVESTMGGLHILSVIVPGLWQIKVDGNELELALLNLAINARDAMAESPGGTLTMSAENVTLLAGDTPAGITGDYVAINISDTGTGIAPDILPKIFDPFFTTKRDNKGTGLGLSQVHGFAHQSGGTVTIASELGKGTRITLYLPRTSEKSEPEIAVTAVATKVAGRVLLVEDDPEVAVATQGMLQELGYEVTAVGNALDGLAAATTQRFDLVFSDIIMAGEMDGVGLAMQLREKLPKLPVLLASGYNNPNANDAGIPLLRKPYNLTELGRALRAIAPTDAPNLVRFPERR